MNRLIAMGIVAVVAGTPEVRAEDSAVESLPAPAPSAVSEPVTSPNRRSKSGGNRVREKDTEGSQAPNRFEGESVIKSRYEFDGVPLEVDPD